MTAKVGAPSVPYPIESVDNVLRLLQLLHEREELGVTAAARLLGVAPSTAHRLFAMLHLQSGFPTRRQSRMISNLYFVWRPSQFGTQSQGLIPAASAVCD